MLPIVAIAGPSGSGKSRLASEIGGVVLHIELDRFYRSRGELMSSGARIDWENISTYKIDEACDLLITLADDKPAIVPIYDLATDAIVGNEVLEPNGRILLAEGVFASAVASNLVAANVEVISICLTGSRIKHAYRRIRRDIREKRLSISSAIIRGMKIMVSERRYVNSSVELGARAMNRTEIKELLKSMTESGLAS